MRRAFPLLLLVLSPRPVAAHDLWLEPVEGRWALLRGHAPGGHAAPEGQPYPVDFVQGFVVVDELAHTLPLQADPGPPWSIPDGGAAVLVSASSGVWSKTPYGTKNLPPDRVEQVIRSWRSLESVKLLRRWSEALTRPLTRQLELVCEEDPFALAPGKLLRLRAYLGARPAVGITVACDGEPRGVTDGQGRIHLRIRHGGRQLIQGRVSLPDSTGALDLVVHTATLELELGEEP